MIPLDDDTVNGTQAVTKRDPNDRGVANPNSPGTVNYANGDVTNYTPPAGSTPPIGAASTAAREAQITALMPQLPANLTNPGADSSGFVSNVAPMSDYHPTTDTSTGPNPSYGPLHASVRNHLIQTNPQAGQIVDDHAAAADSARKQLALTAYVTGLRNDIATKLDSGDFLTHYSQLDHTSPTFESDAAKVFAQFPRATGQAVEDTKNLINSSRKTYVDAMGGGGAAQFQEGSPEAAAYQKAFALHKNPIEAQASANAVQNGEKALQAHIASGVFDPKDLSWDPTTNQPTNPKFWNHDDTVNYSAINAVAAAKTGAILSKAATQRTKEEMQTESDRNDAALAILKQHKTPPKDSDPNYKDYMAAKAFVGARMRGPLRTAAASTTPAPVDTTVPPPTPTGTPPPATATGTPPPVSSVGGYLKF